MPKVPGNMDPSTLQAMTGGMWQPDPPHLMMAAADMNDKGRLIAPEDQSGQRSGASRRLFGGKKTKGVGNARQR